MILTAEVHQRAIDAGVRPGDWITFMANLNDLQKHNPEHYAHSLRVGIYAYDLAKHLGKKDLKLPLYGGCGHDFGKCDIANEVLDAQPFTEAEMEVMRAHPQLGYDALHERWLFTAFVAGLHHKFQPNGYGIEFPPPGMMSEVLIANIKAAALFIMLVDFFDALTTRDNNKGLEPTEKVMVKIFPGCEEEIAWLFAHQILTPSP